MPADARGRSEPRVHGHLRVGPSGTRRGPFRVRVARSGRRAPARQRHLRRPRDADGVPAALDGSPPPGRSCPEPRRRHPLARLAPPLLSPQHRLPGRRRAHRHEPWRSTIEGTRPWSSGTSTTNTPATSASASVTPRRRRSVSGCARDTETSTGSTRHGQRRSGASRTPIGTRSARPSHADVHQPEPAARLARFCSDSWLACFDDQAAILRAMTPEVPVTTNFMGFHKGLDHWTWTPYEDVVSNDSYPETSDPAWVVDAAMTCDLIAIARWWPAVDAHGAGGGPCQLAAAEHDQAPGRHAAGQLPGGRPGSGRRDVLPVASIASRRRAVPQRDDRPRRSVRARLARGQGPGRRAGSPRRDRRQLVSRRTWPSCSTGPAGGRWRAKASHRPTCA